MIIVILSEFDWETDLFTSGAHIWLEMISLLNLNTLHTQSLIVQFCPIQ